MATTLRKKLGSGRHLSAIKRERQNETRRQRNRGTKSTLRTAIKKLITDPSAELLKATISMVDRTVSKGVIPKRRGSRIVSRLTRLVNNSAS